MNDRNGSPVGSNLRPLRGIVPPLVTPLRDRDALDYAGLERLLEHVLVGGVHGLFLLGTTGEAAALSGTLRREFVKHSAEVVAGRVPVLVGVSDTSVVESLRLAHDVAAMGVDAIVVTTPYYLQLEQSELIQYIRTLDRELPLPVFLYNMPGLTKQWFSIDTIREAMQLENVIGLKDSSGDMSYFAEVRSLMAERPDWSLLVGPEMLLADVIKLGGHGCVGGGSNIWPQLLVDLYHAAMQNDQPRVDVLQQTLQELGNIYQFGSYATGCIRGIKCALELLGICNARMADPFAGCDPAQQKAIESQLLKLGLLADKGSPSLRSARLPASSPASRSD